MDIYLNFLSSKDIITILLLALDSEEGISRTELMRYLGVQERALYCKTKVLKNHQLICRTEKIKLTPRGKFLALHLRNMNFYISGGKQVG